MSSRTRDSMSRLSALAFFSCTCSCFNSTACLWGTKQQNTTWAFVLFYFFRQNLFTQFNNPLWTHADDFLLHLTEEQNSLQSSTADMHMRCNRIKQSLFKKPLFLSYCASIHSPFGVIGCPSQTEEGCSWDQSCLPSDLCNKPFKGVWWGLGTSPSFTVKLKMRTLSNYEATFLQSVHIKNVPCLSARDRQINLRLQSLVREQVQAKLLKSARFSTACTPNCHETVAHMHSHWLTLPHLSTHIKHPMNVQTFCYPHVSHNFTQHHKHTPVSPQALMLSFHFRKTPAAQSNAHCRPHEEQNWPINLLCTVTL